MPVFQEMERLEAVLKRKKAARKSRSRSRSRDKKKKKKRRKSSEVSEEEMEEDDVAKGSESEQEAEVILPKVTLLLTLNCSISNRGSLIEPEVEEKKKQEQVC